MKAKGKFYTVWVSFRGYDINALVFAQSLTDAKKKALADLHVHVEITRLTAVLEKEMIKDEVITRRDLNAARKKGVLIYDEGT